MLFLLRYSEAISWYLSLVVFAWAFKGWFFMIWGLDLLALSCVFCATADVREDDWEVRRPAHPNKACTPTGPPRLRLPIGCRAEEMPAPAQVAVVIKVLFQVFYTGEAIGLVFPRARPSNRLNGAC